MVIKVIADRSTADGWLCAGLIQLSFPLHTEVIVAAVTAEAWQKDTGDEKSLLYYTSHALGSEDANVTVCGPAEWV